MNITKTEDVKSEDVNFFRKTYFNKINENTPDEIKNNTIFNLDNSKEFEFLLTKELIEKYDLKSWFANYKKEAMVSTAGIRGAQNVLYSWDTRFPLNEVGVTLATLAKVLVLKEENPNKELNKLCSGEVRYNTDRYIEIISRIQAAQKIKTHLHKKDKLSIWLSSFIIFTLDYDGGEYVTSSHAMSSKIATKDLDSQGSQFTPEMSMKFIAKIQEILDIAEEKDYALKFSSKSNQYILNDLDHINLYLDYLKKGIATPNLIKLLKEQINNGLEIMCDCVGGCMYPIISKIYSELGISDLFSWNNIEYDSFFHGIGKTMYNPLHNKKEFFDWGCDTTIKEVIESMGYQKLLINKPDNFSVMMFDPDGDRIVIGQIESKERESEIKRIGIDYFYLDDDRLFVYYTPNKLFLLTMIYKYKQLESENLLENHNRFIIRTAPSAMSWQEWANYKNIKTINVPVGFKEISITQKKVEKQIINNPDSDVIIKDIFDKEINLGKNPRLLFAGEESGGMITGPEELIKSNNSRIAISMREKSAAEASILITGLIANLHKEKKSISEYLDESFIKNKITWTNDYRLDRKLYNESNPNPISLKQEKLDGEKIRDLVDKFYLSLSLAYKENKLSLVQIKEILFDLFPNLNFNDLKNVYFVGDGSYFEFENKFIELRKSGTDAVLKAYFCGTNLDEGKNYCDVMLNFNGELSDKFKEYIDIDFYNDSQEKAIVILREFEKV